jgi:hypothetical protein
MFAAVAEPEAEYCVRRRLWLNCESMYAIHTMSEVSTIICLILQVRLHIRSSPSLLGFQLNFRKHFSYLM